MPQELLKNKKQTQFTLYSPIQHLSSSSLNNVQCDSTHFLRAQIISALLPMLDSQENAAGSSSTLLLLHVGSIHCWRKMRAKRTFAITISAGKTKKADLAHLPMACDTTRPKKAGKI